MKKDLIDRLRIRAKIRRGIPRGEPDRIADILEEAAAELEKAQAIAKECYEEAYAYELEYPSTPWSRLLFRVAKVLNG